MELNLEQFDLSIGQEKKVRKILNFGIEEVLKITKKDSEKYLSGYGQNYQRLEVVYRYKGEIRRSEFSGQDNGKPYKS